MKKIMAELWFEDDFTPPEYFEEPCHENDWRSKCFECPLHSWSDDYGTMDCHFCGDFEEKDGKTLCPIKKYFTDEKHIGG